MRILSLILANCFRPNTFFVINSSSFLYGRCRTIRSANSGPMPSTLSNARVGAVLMSILGSLNLAGWSVSSTAAPEVKPSHRATPKAMPKSKITQHPIGRTIRVFTPSL